MDNAYKDYYRNQAGSGLTAFEGLQYQRGHGFFGTLFSSLIKPLGKYLGKRALETGVNMGNDLLQGEDMRSSLKKNLKLAGNQLLDDGIARIKKFSQTGKGRKRRRRRRKKANPDMMLKMARLKKRKSLKRRRPKRKESSRKKKTRRSRKRRSRKSRDKFNDLF